MGLLISIFWSIFILFIWFDTNAMSSWLKFINNRFFKIGEWENWNIGNSKISYLEYLHMTKKTFFYKLISCRQCLLFWISLIVSIPKMENIAPIYILSYLFYYLFTFIIKKISS